MKNIPKLETYLGILATVLIVLGLFLVVLNEPKRIASAQQAQLESDLDEAMTLYAQNCSVCHGLAGEGIGATPPLNSEALRNSDYNSLFKIIARG
ncbi:MAG: c-type cytochrome, partial [Anaerolineae bacterium]